MFLACQCVRVPWYWVSALEAAVVFRIAVSEFELGCRLPMNGLAACGMVLVKSKVGSGIRGLALLPVRERRKVEWWCKVTGVVRLG